MPQTIADRIGIGIYEAAELNRAHGVAPPPSSPGPRGAPGAMSRRRSRENAGSRPSLPRRDAPPGQAPIVFDRLPRVNHTNPQAQVVTRDGIVRKVYWSAFDFRMLLQQFRNAPGILYPFAISFRRHFLAIEEIIYSVVSSVGISLPNPKTSVPRLSAAKNPV